MIEVLKDLIPNFSHFQEHEIIFNGTSIGYQSTLITKGNKAFAGGTAATINLARRICSAEAIERAQFLLLMQSPDAEKRRLLLNEYPTTCGFAAGFDNRSTTFRSVCEAVERWAWVQWIDYRKGLDTVHPNLKTNLSRYFVSHFDDVVFFQKKICLSRDLKPSFIDERLIFSVAIGVKDGGIFPGSRVTTEDNDSWEHPLLEAWRHSHIFSNELKTAAVSDIFEKRIKFFGLQGRKALNELLTFKIAEFPTARIRIVESVQSAIPNITTQYYVYRSLCHSFIGWNKGDETRFIY